VSRDLFWYLRRSKLDNLLFLIADAIRGMFSRNQPIMSVSAVKVGGLYPRTGNVTITAWNLSDLAYLAICESNDFRAHEPSAHDLVALCNLFLVWDEQRSREELIGLSNDEFLIKFAVGFSQKQFWYQELHRVRQEFNRQVELLEVIPAEVGTYAELDAACVLATGFDVRTFRTILFGLYAVAGTQADIALITSDDGGATKIHPALTAKNVNIVANLYASDYTEIRKSPLAENHFHVKPVVRTSSNRLCALNAYLFAKKVADGPFWAIREHHRLAGSQAFVNAFGIYFERYVEKLLRHCLRQDRFERVPQPRRGACADWFLYTRKYRVIIELKSSLAALMLRRLYPDIQAIRTYLGKFQEGILQLDSTEQAYPDPSRTTIKLLVHYETLYTSDAVLRPMVIESVIRQLKNPNNLYFCDIGEFEWLVCIAGASESTAEDVLAAKIAAEVHPELGREFAQVIPRVTELANTYILKSIDHWGSYIPALKQAAGIREA
jgi:hypothetical protein